MASLITALLILWRKLACGWTVGLAEPAGWTARRGSQTAEDLGRVRVRRTPNPRQARAPWPRGACRAEILNRANIGLRGAERQLRLGAKHPDDPLTLPLCPVV